MKSSPSQHMPHLDSLRALAVFSVMIHHWAPGFLGFEPWGELGVRCFFVLSGFLITGLLLRARIAVESGRSPMSWQIRQFYIRRSLRIFPIYYLTLVVGVLLGMFVLRETVWWHAGYVSNIYFALRGKWQGYISHLWSLSVEEQFYLLWPALVLTVPRPWLPRVFGAFIAAGVLTRAVLAMTLGSDHLTLKVLLPSCFDSLVAGAVVAWFFAQRPLWATVPGILRQSLFPVAIALFLVRCLCDFLQVGKPFLAVVGPLVEAVFFAGVVARCANGLPGLLGRFMNFAPLQYFGRISYGLYLYHMFAGYMALMLADKLGLRVPGPGLAQFALYFVMTLVAAVVSERLIERPFNYCKRFFPTDGQSTRAPVARPAAGLGTIMEGARGT